MDLIRLWGRFRKSRLFRPFYLALIAVTGVFLMVPANVCFAGLMLPLLILVIPHWFGEKKIRNHAINGLIVIGIVPLLFGLVFGSLYMGQTVPPLSAEGGGVRLSDGVVSPPRASGTGSFNFTAVLTSANATNATVWVRVLSIEDLAITNETLLLARDTAGGGALTDGNLTNGERFYGVLPLTALVHQYDFHIETPNRTWIAWTGPAPGPFNAEFTTYTSFWAYNGYVFALIFVLPGFFIFLMIYWWIGKSREIRSKAVAGRKRDDGDGEFTCTNCGADVKEGDAVCPNCGAEFEGGAGDSRAS